MKYKYRCNNCGNIASECQYRTVCDKCRCEKCERLKELCDCREYKTTGTEQRPAPF